MNFLVAVFAMSVQVFPMGLSGKAALAQIPQVQRHLKMSAKQISQVVDLVNSPLDSESRPDMYYTMAAIDPKLANFLTAKQLARLDEIWLQDNGLLAATIPEVADKLGLSKATRDKFQEINEDLMGKVMSEFAPEKTMASSFSAAKVHNSAARKALKSLLTASQLKVWSRMLGRPFTMPNVAVPKAIRSGHSLRS